MILQRVSQFVAAWLLLVSAMMTLAAYDDVRDQYDRPLPAAQNTLSDITSHVVGQQSSYVTGTVSIETARGQTEVTDDTVNIETARGQTEVTVTRQHVTAVETMMTSLGERGVFVRQLTDGRTILRMLYMGRWRLVRCDMERVSARPATRLRRLQQPRDQQTARRHHNGQAESDVTHVQNTDTVQQLDNNNNNNNNNTSHPNRPSLPVKLVELVDWSRAKRDCLRVRQQTRRYLLYRQHLGSTARRHTQNTNRQMTSNLTDFPEPRHELMSGKASDQTGVKIPLHIADDSDVSIPLHIADDSDVSIPLHIEDDRDVNWSERQEVRGSRRRRSTLIFPGTNWCGAGNQSRDGDVGHSSDSSNTDRCCKEHDSCPVTIEAVTTKYNLYNYRLTTISHCECDQRFHSCLRNADDDVANMMGSVFFNILRTKCFILSRQAACAERTWWGKCIKHKQQVVAEIRDPLPY